MSNLDLLSAGFSAILGTNVLPHGGTGIPIHDLFSSTYVMRPLEAVDPGEMFDLNVVFLSGKTRTIRVSGKQTIAHVKAEIQKLPDDKFPSIETFRLIYNSTHILDNEQTLDECGIQPDATVFVVLRLRGGGAPLFNTDDLDPDFDFDFTDVKDDGKRYMRGGFEYKRPYGWKRIAIKVVGRYADDKWLGPNGIRTDQARGEWPVSYHGTNMKSAKMILEKGFKAGPRALYGKGIYTSPSLEMVERLYAQEFTHNGKSYKIVFQNRVNPDQRNGHLEIIPAAETGVGADYWLSPACTKDATDVRPYGILIREVPQPTLQSMPSGPRPVAHMTAYSPVLCPKCAARQNKKRKRKDN